MFQITVILLPLLMGCALAHPSPPPPPPPSPSDIEPRLPASGIVEPRLPPSAPPEPTKRRLPASAPPEPTKRRLTPPLIIAHRGDKALIPEHTLGSYELAMIERVDYVEPDLVMTNDSVLVCYHDITLRSGTDVSSRPEFSHLMVPSRTVELEGRNVTYTNDWFISDFSLEQLQTLNVVQRNTGVRPMFFNSLFTIPTFQEFIDAVHAHTLKRVLLHHGNWTPVGIIPELKHPSYHSASLPGTHGMETQFLATLESNGYRTSESSPPETCKSNNTLIPCPPVIIQSFEIPSITHLSTTTTIPLLTLVDTSNPRYLTYKGFELLSNQTTYIGLWKELLFTGTEAEIGDDDYDHDEIEGMGGFIPPQEIVSHAHNLGMLVGIYTIYHSEEKSMRGCAVQCTNETKTEELEFYFDLGVDAFFVEGVCESLRIRDNYYYSNVITDKSSPHSSANKLHYNTLILITLVLVHFQLLLKTK